MLHDEETTVAAAMIHRKPVTTGF